MGNGKSQKKLKMLSQIHGEKCWPMVEKMSPCEEACPIHMDIPSYIIAVSQGKFKEALDVVRDTNPFPSVCGRICHHPCEDACTRALIDRSLAIEYLKRSIGQYEQSNGTRVKRVKRRKKEKIAVIGSGPAGLTAAHDLVKKGYGATVYESLPVAGGMLAAGIPEFNLPKEVVQKDINYIRSLGVDIKTNMKIGQNLTMADLWSQGYSAVLLATGAWKSTELSIPGKELKGVIQALPFLREAKIGEKPRLKGSVVIIGGGNVAVDAARTALRSGAEKVSLACLEERAGMPAFEWEIEKSEKEGVRIYPALAPQQFYSKLGKKVNRVDFKQVASVRRDSSGKVSWTLEQGPDVDVSLTADTVIISIGQVPDPSFVSGANTNDSGTFAIDPETMATNVPGLFAAGDAVKLPGTVVEAIAAGHRVGESIDRYLQGKSLKSKGKKKKVEALTIEEEMIPPFLIKKDRWDMPTLSFKDAVRSFGETNLGYTPWQAIEEAKRCLNCRMCGNCLFDRGQLCFETSARLL